MPYQDYLLEGAEKQSDVSMSQSTVSFRQSYVLDRFDNTINEEDTAENAVISQVDKIEAVKVQLSKFKSDLSNVPTMTPAIAKTLENMEYLEEDVGKLAQQLRVVRNKISNETMALKQRESQAKDKIDLLKHELGQNIAQLDEKIGRAHV